MKMDFVVAQSLIGDYDDRLLYFYHLSADWCYCRFKITRNTLNTAALTVEVIIVLIHSSRWSELF